MTISYLYMGMKKPQAKTLLFFFISYVLILSSLCETGFVAAGAPRSLTMELKSQSAIISKEEMGRWDNKKTTRRLMIGSRAPTCTYNECRGCRYNCSLKQVPVDVSDPMNSAYHYRCVCHRS